MALDDQTRVVCLAGGVGGAKLALGLSHILDPDHLTLVVNTADDFEHLGLYISPDVDTVMYTLAGLSNPKTGWGLAGETWNSLEAINRLGGDTWFRLGDHDLATHILRTDLLRQGKSFSAICHLLSTKLGVKHTIIPMSDDPVRTIVHTDEGPLPFQEYFVHRRCEPRVRDFEFLGITSAQPHPQLLGSLSQCDVLIYAPSNPYVSLAPILNLKGVQEMIATRRSSGMRVVAVSPIVGGAAIKGPAAKMMIELGFESSVTALAEHYVGSLDGLVIDQVDATSAARIESLGMRVWVTDTIMKSEDDKIRLAQEVIGFAKKFTG